MKIGEKIRIVLAENPEIRRRRAQLNAVGYLFRHDNKVTIRWYSNTEHVTTMITNLNAAINMKPLCDYKPKEVKLKGLKLINE